MQMVLKKQEHLTWHLSFKRNALMDLYAFMLCYVLFLSTCSVFQNILNLNTSVCYFKYSLYISAFLESEFMSIIV